MENIEIIKIEKISIVESTSLLYDIEVADNNNFFADSILVHNCKLDGMRANVIIENGKVSIRSRNGKPIELHGCFDAPFLEAAGADNLVFDGELMVMGDGKFLDRQTGNGILNKAVKGTISKEEASQVHIVLYDYIDDLNAWRNGKYKVTYADRFEGLKDCIPSLRSVASLVEYRISDTPAEVNAYFQECLARGEEGIILKNPDGIWEDKRSKDLIKFKSEIVQEMRVTGWEEGTGKNVGLLGNLIVQSEDGLIEVGVGTGFTDEHRKTLTPENTIGKIVSIKYNQRIQAKGDKKESLFLPVFLEIREDKDVADLAKDFK